MSRCARASLISGRQLSQKTLTTDDHRTIDPNSGFDLVLLNATPVPVATEVVISVRQDGKVVRQRRGGVEPFEGGGDYLKAKLGDLAQFTSKLYDKMDVSRRPTFVDIAL